MTSPSTNTLEIKRVVVHPLVLLSVVDHFNRIKNQRRVVGVLLGSWRQGVLDIANSFAGWHILSLTASALSL